MTCFFIGHRDAPEFLQQRLVESVERHITLYGLREFIVGHYGRFDAMAASAVRAAKNQHPDISLVLLLPYYPYRESTEGFDATFYPPGMENVPKPFAIVRANEYMMRNCSHLICYNKDYVGNTRVLIEKAEKRARKGLLHIENLVSESNNLSTTGEQ